MNRVLREPLLHFVVLGALIFFVYSQTDDAAAPSDTRIVITAGQQQNLVQTFERTWQRPPTRSEFDGLIDDYIRQELAYRQAQSMGIDRDDIVVRRRLRQKLEMFAGDLVDSRPPTIAELQGHFEENADRYRLPVIYSLRQVFFRTGDDFAAAEAKAEDALEKLRAGKVAPNAIGDRTLLPAVLVEASETLVGSRFGHEFATALEAVETGKWSGPLRSGFGLHVVRIDERQEPRLPELDSVRDEVERDWFAARRTEALDAFYAGLSENYEIVIEPGDGLATTEPQ
jgi:hypothetical protein